MTEIEKIEKAIDSINNLISKAKFDKSIDVEDLKAERRNSQLELKKIRKNISNLNQTNNE